MPVQTESFTQPNIFQRVRQDVIKRLESFNPSPGTFITSFCVGATIAAFTVASPEPNFMASIAILARELGTNLLADQISNWKKPDRIGSQDELASAIADYVEKKLQEGDPLPWIGPLLEKFGLLEVALENWQQNNDERWQKLLEEIAQLSQLIALTKEMRDLVEQLLSPEKRKRQVYIGMVWGHLESYRTTAIRYFSEIGAKVLAASESPLLPESQRLDLIRNCDLFIGIYAPAESAPTHEELQLCRREFEQALRHMRRIIVICAAPDTKITNPPICPVYKLPDGLPREPVWVKRPLPVSRGIRRTIDTIWAYITGNPTPKAKERAKQIAYEEQYRQQRRQYRQQQEQYIKYKLDPYEATYRKEVAAFEEAEALYRERVTAHEAFVNRVIYHFPDPPLFHSSPELQAHLRQQLDLFDLIAIFGLSSVQVTLGWQKQVETQIGEIRDASLNEAALEKPSMTSLPEIWIPSYLQNNWHDDLDPFVQRVEETMNSIQNSIYIRREEAIHAQCDKWLEAIKNWRRKPYTEITKLLKNWLTLPILVDLENNLVKVTRKSGKRKLEELISPWKQARRELKNMLANPKYGRCFLVMGSPGSGKTHFMARLLLQQLNPQLTEPRVFFLYLSHNEPYLSENAVQPEELILQTARFQIDNNSGVTWRSLEELAAFVALQGEKATDNRLVILIDDLHLMIRDHGLDLHALQSLIERHTHIHHLYWIISVSETYYSLVTGIELDSFWTTYGYVPDEGTAVANWIGLDILNLSSDQWKNIIKHDLDKPLSEEHWAQLDQQSKTWLTNPFIAWLFNTAHREEKLPIHELLNLNYVQFIERFWKEKLKHLALQLNQRVAIQDWESGLQHTTYLISGKVVDDNTTMLSSNLTQYIIEHHTQENDVVKKPNNVKVFISWLTQMGLLASETIDGHRHVWQLQNHSLWQWQSGKYMVDQLASISTLQKQPDEWIAKRFAKQEEAIFWEGVLEFLVQISDVQAKERFPPGYFLYIIKIVLGMPIEYQSIVWLAASKISASRQKELAESINHNTRVNLATNVDLDRYLYFLKYAEPPINGGIPLWLRIKLVRDAIGSVGYTGYLTHFLHYIASFANDPLELAEAMAYLHGIEDEVDERLIPEMTTKLANQSYELLIKNATQREMDLESHNILINQAILNFLRTISSFSPIHPKNKKDKKFHYQRYWLKLLEKHCQAIIFQYRDESMTWLESNGWLSWKPMDKELTITQETVRWAMDEQFSKHCGRWFRKNKGYAKDNAGELYTLIVNDWANNEQPDVSKQRAQKKMAAFLIKHTVPSDWEDIDADENEFLIPDDKHPIKVGKPLWDIFLKLRHEQDTRIRDFMRKGVMAHFFNHQAQYFPREE